ARWAGGDFDTDYAETFSEFTDRVDGALDAVFQAMGSGESTLVVSSAGAISWTATRLLGGDFDQWMAFNRVTINTGITKIISGRNGTSLISFNDHGHLPPADVTYRCERSILIAAGDHRRYASSPWEARRRGLSAHAGLVQGHTCRGGTVRESAPPLHVSESPLHQTRSHVLRLVTSRAMIPPPMRIAPRSPNVLAHAAPVLGRCAPSLPLSLPSVLPVVPSAEVVPSADVLDALVRASEFFAFESSASESVEAESLPLGSAEAERSESEPVAAPSAPSGSAGAPLSGSVAASAAPLGSVRAPPWPTGSLAVLPSPPGSVAASSPPLLSGPDAASSPPAGSVDPSSPPAGSAAAAAAPSGSTDASSSPAGSVDPSSPPAGS